MAPEEELLVAPEVVPEEDVALDAVPEEAVVVPEDVVPPSPPDVEGPVPLLV